MAMEVSDGGERSRAIREVLLPWAISRIGILIVGLLALSLGTSQVEYPVSDLPWIELWARWDSGWYSDIAANGYRYVADQMSSVAFYPLYPLLMRLLTFGSTDRETLAVAGWLISNLALLGALFALRQLLLSEGMEPGLVRRVLILLVAFPTAFYYGAVYTESLFLLLTVAAFICAGREHWLAAGLLGALSAATRSLGVLLCVPLATVALQQRPLRWHRLVAAALVPLGLLAFMAYLWHAFRDPLVFVKASAAWGRTSGFQSAAERVRELVASPDLAARVRAVWMDLAFLLVGAALVYGALRRQPWRYKVYSVYALAVPVATMQVVSVPRYLIVAFPLFVVAAGWLRARWLYRSALGLCIFLQIVCVWRWSLGYWVA